MNKWNEKKTWSDCSFSDNKMGNKWLPAFGPSRFKEQAQPLSGLWALPYSQTVFHDGVVINHPGIREALSFGVQPHCWEWGGKKKWYLWCYTPEMQIAASVKLMPLILTGILRGSTQSCVGCRKGQGQTENQYICVIYWENPPGAPLLFLFRGDTGMWQLLQLGHGPGAPSCHLSSATAVWGHEKPVTWGSECCQKGRGGLCAASPARERLHISPWGVKWAFSCDNRTYFLF